MEMKVKVGISNRHVHLKESTYFKLFNEPLVKYKDLKQKNEYASIRFLNIKTNQGIIEHVRVMGPFRDYDQIEISQSDARKLGIHPPIRNSGELNDAEEIILETELNSIPVKGCIIANRHVHMPSDMARELNLKNLDDIKLIIPGKRGGTLNAVVKVSENATLEAHIDIDEAAAFSLESEQEIMFSKDI